MLKIISFFIITLFDRLYMRVGILLTCGKHVHDCIISLRGEVWVHKANLIPPLLLKCLYQARKVSAFVLVCFRYRFFLFLRFWYLIWEVYRQCGTFCFSFYDHIINRYLVNAWLGVYLIFITDVLTLLLKQDSIIS